MSVIIGRKCRCTAFPERIPDEIWYDNYDHTQPYPGDGGIRFEKLNIEALQTRIVFRKNTLDEIEAMLNSFADRDEIGTDQE